MHAGLTHVWVIILHRKLAVQPERLPAQLTTLVRVGKKSGKEKLGSPQAKGPPNKQGGTFSARKKSSLWEKTNNNRVNIFFS